MNDELIGKAEEFLDFLIEEQNGDHSVDCATSSLEEAHYGCTCSMNWAVELVAEIRASYK